MRSFRTAVLFAVFTLAAVACADSGGDPWVEVEIDDLTESDRNRFERGKGAAALLGLGLMGRLMEAVADAGFPKAIEVCRDEAPRFAKEVAERTGLRLGRTSHRLRSDANASPDWIPDLNAETAQVLRGPEGALRMTLPIRAKEMCLNCHGSDEEIDPAVRAALDAAYPEDQARGFAAGDLRGQFWIEVPGGTD